MTLSLGELTAAFKKTDNENKGRPNNYYPFWEIKPGQQAIVRFLPDKNPENPMGFLVEKLMHNLEVNGDRKNVPCLTMYGEECPVCKVSSAFYKEKDDVNGKKYWRKKQHIAQALVIEDPLPADDTTNETHEGKVRFLALGYQLFNVIKEAFEGGELEEVPFAFKGGCNFIIKKTEQGNYATYSIGSRFARKSTDLTEDEIAMVEEQMVDLSTLLPKAPPVEKIEGMLQAALTGAEYSEHKETATNKPDLRETVTSAMEAAEATPAATPEAEPQTADEFNEEADELLKELRGRRKKKA